MRISIKEGRIEYVEKYRYLDSVLIKVWTSDQETTQKIATANESFNRKKDTT